MSEQFALIISCQKVKSNIDETSIMTEEGEQVWISRSDFCPTSTTMFMYPRENPPTDLMTFSSKEKAEEFAKQWKGHPWYYIPNGNYEVVTIRPKMVEVQKGFEVINPTL